MRRWIGWIKEHPEEGYAIVRAWTERGARKKAAAAVGGAPSGKTMEVRRLTPAMRWADERGMSVWVRSGIDTLWLRRRSAAIVGLLLLLALAPPAAEAQLVGERIAEVCPRAVVRYICSGRVPAVCDRVDAIMTAPFNPQRLDYEGRWGHPEAASRGNLAGEGCGLDMTPGGTLYQKLSLPADHRLTPLDVDDPKLVSCAGERAICHEWQPKAPPGPDGDCPSPWNCGAMPPEVRAGCLERSLWCADVTSVSHRGCWHQPRRSVLGKQLTYYARGVAGCDPALPVEPPPPPPPCGDGIRDFGECACEAWCVADCGPRPASCDPPVPPVSGCTAALDAYGATRAAEAEAWAAVERECRP